MATINRVKQQAETDTPLLMFQCLLPSGHVERWCSHGVFLNGNYYEARVVRHNLFDLQLSSDDAMDGISRLSVTLANADSALSELNAAVGFKGAQLTVYFGFADLPSLQITTESTILFRGIAGDPDEITEDLMTLSFVNKLSLQRIALPEVRIQRTCPWNFPTNPSQRTEAKDGGTSGKFSKFLRCGYSAGIPGGYGSLDAEGQPFVSCDKSRSQCEQRGMFNVDQNQLATRRFGGMEFVPSAVNVRTSGDKTTHLSALITNIAKYNDAVPLVYGTAWLKAPIIFARNDGNLTHIEVLLGLGTVTSVLKVVVNDVEIPLAVSGQDMTATGWYSVFSWGATQGEFNNDFLDSSGKPAGDPYGSIAAMAVVVPNRISSGASLPVVEVLMQGVKVDTFNPDGSLASNTYSNNPAWIILDILRRCGWTLAELDLGAFYDAAQFCGVLISTTDMNGNPLSVQRFQCNLVQTKRQSAATIVRGIRVASSLMLRYGATGLLELLPETTIGIQQSELPDGSNSTDPLASGWPAYEFSDGSAPFSGIVRSPSGASTVRLTSRSIAESSNRLSVEFQDESNEYQQDSLSVVDSSDSALIGYEITSQSAALGIANYNQAERVLLRQLDKTLRGNLFVEFQTSFRAMKVRPGDIIALTYLKEGFERLPFRVTKLTPSMNYKFVTITGQIHNDDWYSDDLSILSGAGRQPLAQMQTPRPLVGLIPHQFGGTLEYFDFQIAEDVQILTDGTATDLLTVRFSQPTKPSPSAPAVPLVSLAPSLIQNQGTLPGGRTFYYAVSATDAAGQEGPLSFTVKATISAETDGNSVQLQNLSFPLNAVSFNVYRGTTPQLLYRIAAQVAISDSYVDAGAAPQPFGPPDASFDHANFYYRYEVAGPYQVSGSAAKLIQCEDMGATSGAYSGMLVRVVEGTGKGQERSISDNNSTSLTLSTAWTTMPDTTSVFVICESAWRFAAISSVSPTQFSVPYRAQTVVQLTGRSANAHNQEGTPELCPLTRIPLGQSKPDFGVPCTPSFTLQAPGAGQVTLSEIGFSSDSNISSISSGTLNLYYWSEIAAIQNLVQSSLDSVSTSITIAGTASLGAGTYCQIDDEIVLVLATGSNNAYTILRAQLGSTAASHAAGALVLTLLNGKMVVPFAADFFQNRASVNLIHTFSFPDVRVVAAQFFVSNGFGSSQTQATCFTNNGEGGLRTLSGGQFNLQVSGYVATMQNATPPLTIEATHAIRDVRATLGQAAAGYDIAIDVLQNANVLCTLKIPSGSVATSLTDGAALTSLQKDATISTNLTLTPNLQGSGSALPGKDLTVTIRL